MSDKHDRKRTWTKFKPALVPPDSRAPPRQKVGRITRVERKDEPAPIPTPASKKPRPAPSIQRPPPYVPKAPQRESRAHERSRHETPRRNEYDEEVYEGESTFKSIEKFIKEQGLTISRVIIRKPKH